jgi:beta-ureidopropionase / N-carbamoyl-L-amino-acid hydrolase
VSRPDRFRELWDQLAPIGRDPAGGGYVRYAWSPPELSLREWFRKQAALRQMPVEEDGNGNLFAWWAPQAPDRLRPAEPGTTQSGGARGAEPPVGVLTGSHFDSVPHGGGYDGPLGIVSGFLAIDELRERGEAPRRPVGVAAFAEEEGARFGVPCLGSRLLTGSLDPVTAAGFTDAGAATLADAMGGSPAGHRPDLLTLIGAFIELHIEQGRALVDRSAAVGVASAIWPHGRWRLDIRGEGNHAGTTRMADRRDPMLTYAFAVLAANKEARLRGAYATMGRVEVEPNATNAIPARVRGWLDARAAEPATLDDLVEAIHKKVAERAVRDGTEVELHRESATPMVEFDRTLAGRLSRLLGDAPVLPTGAGHDAGVLAAHVPTAMLFVRNPTGVSHAPAEHATDADCAAGVAALADVLAELACR